MNNIKSLYDLYSEVERISKSLPNVNTFTESFDNLNREDVEYSAVVFQFRDGTQPSEGFVTYRFYLGYVDRVNEVSGSPSSNETLIQSVAEQSLRTIINKVNEEVEFKYGSLTPFEQRFTALTSGCYIDCSVTLAVSDCNYESGSVLRELVIDAKENGSSEYVPGPGVDGWKKVRLDVNVRTDADGIKFQGSHIKKFPEGIIWEPRTGYNAIGLFKNCTSLESLPPIDLSGVKLVNEYAYGCIALKEAGDFYLPMAISANSMFEGCSLKKIGTLEIPKAQGTERMFYAVQELEEAPKMITTSSLREISYMFYYCYNITSYPDYDFSGVVNMNYTFAKNRDLVDIPIWNFTKLLYAVGSFRECTSLVTFPKWDNAFATVVDMDEMFFGDTKLETIGRLNCRSITSAKNAFYNCSSLTTLGGFSLMSVDFDLSGSPLLTHDSLLNVINRLGKVSEAKTLTLGSTNLAKLTDEEKAIATNKGWTLK